MVMDLSAGKRMRILAVDDEPEALEIYRQAFRSLSDQPGDEGEFSITCCRRGDTAVDCVKAALDTGDHYAVVFLDLNLTQGPDGITIGGQIRELDPYVNFVIVTGLPDVSPQEIARRIPPKDKMLYVQKPFHIQEIRQFASALGAKWQSERLLRRTNKELEKKVRELEQATRQLMENNNALSVLARNLEKSRKESEKRVFQRAVMLMMPIVEKLRQAPRLKPYRTDLTLLEGYIKDLTSGFAGELKAVALLSMTEMRIASMIRNGMTSEEIAKHLYISVSTVKTHRKNIRKKLNLCNSRINLRTYLMSEIVAE